MISMERKNLNKDIITIGAIINKMIQMFKIYLTCFSGLVDLEMLELEEDKDNKTLVKEVDPKFTK